MKMFKSQFICKCGRITEVFDDTKTYKKNICSQCGEEVENEAIKQYNKKRIEEKEKSKRKNL